MFTTRMRPNVSVKPLASRKSSAASEVPLIACRTALLVMGRNGVTRRRPRGRRGRRARRPGRGSPLVWPPLQELRGRPLPELGHRLVRLERHVGEDVAEHRVLDLLDPRDVHVLDRVVVLVHAHRTAGRVDPGAAHRPEEGGTVLHLAVDRVDRRLGPQTGRVRGLGEPGGQPLVLARERVGEGLVRRRVQARRVVQGVADQPDGAVVRLRQHVLVQPVPAVDLELLVHAEVEPGLEQPHAVHAHDDRRDAVGVLRDRRDRGAVVPGPDRVPDDLRDLAPELGVGPDRAERDLVAPRIVLADERHVAQAELLVQVLAEGVPDLAGGDRGAHHRRRAVPLGDDVGPGRVHHERHARLLADLGHRRPLVAAERADHEVHLLLVHDAARLGERLVGVARRVGDDDLDLAPAGLVARLLPEELEAVHHVAPRRGEGAGHGGQQADLDRLALGVRRARRADAERRQQDGESSQESMNPVSGRSHCASSLRRVPAAGRHPGFILGASPRCQSRARGERRPAVSDSTLRFGSDRGARRSEDAPLLTGRGRFTDDLGVAGQAHAAFVRSTVGHAEIRGIDVTGAMRKPGVVGVFTGRDLAADGLGAIPPVASLAGRGGTPMVAAAMPPLALDRVRYVGEPLAIVVAETAAQARDAADAVVADLAERPAVADVERAMAPGAPAIWPQAPGNIALDWTDGDAAAVEAAFARAAHVERVRLLDTRLAPSALEPRAAIGQWDAAAERYTLIAGTQGVAVVRRLLAEGVFKVPPQKIRVLTYDVGGGFGMKVQTYPEYAALLYAARRVGRPVKWCATRLESFLADTHGRDGVLEAELALDAGGRFLALRARTRVGIGAYVSTYAAVFATNNTKNCLSSVYVIPAIQIDVKMVFTNAAPLGPYRGAGRPEALYLIERLIDAAARATGIDRVELRRRNLIPPSAMPYRAPNSQVYDSGEFEAALDEALALADWQGVPARRAAAERAGRLRGIGLGCFLEVAGGILDETVDLLLGRRE